MKENTIGSVDLPDRRLTERALDMSLMIVVVDAVQPCVVGKCWLFIKMRLHGAQNERGGLQFLVGLTQSVLD